MKTALLYHQNLERYSFGKGHPLKGDRFRKFYDFFELRFAPFKDQFQIIEPHSASDDALELVHTRDYIKAIRSASGGKAMENIFEYVSADNINPSTGYIPEGIEEGARIIAGASLQAGELLTEKKFDKVIVIGGGMHHAKASYGEGFCFYNDVAVSIRNLQKKYNLGRILVLDTDAHAGNGTKEIFYDDPEVLFIDIHQDPHTIYPGTGFIEEIGSGKAEGFTVNIPVSPGTGNQAYEYIFQEIIFPLAEEFQPQAIIRYGGSDPHYLDELTDLGLTFAGFKMLGQKVNQLAKEHTQGRCIDLLLSGYSLKVLPYAWSALISGLLDLDMDLSGFKEESAPPASARLSETKKIVEQLKKLLKKYWKCIG